MSEAEATYTRIFITLTRRHSDIQTFRRLVRASEPLATSHASAEDARLVDAILKDPKFDEYFLDRQKAVEFFGGPDALRASLTLEKMTTLRRIVDTTSIVVMHSALDAALTDLCRLGARLHPEDWETLVERQQVSLASVKAEPYSVLLATKLDSHLDALERESILKRSDVLFAVCHPTAGYTPLGNYTWNRDELARLDRLRQDLVHGGAEGSDLSKVDEKVEYLVRTGIFFWGMLHDTYGLQMDPLWMMQASKK